MAPGWITELFSDCTVSIYRPDDGSWQPLPSVPPLVFARALSNPVNSCFNLFGDNTWLLRKPDFVLKGPYGLAKNTHQPGGEHELLVYVCLMPEYCFWKQVESIVEWYT
jgi:hypothetical protein